MEENNQISQPKSIVIPQRGQSIKCQEKRYYIGDHINDGYFGKVFSCTDDWGNELVAKILKPNGLTFEATIDAWKLEVEKLTTLRHPNITYIYDAFICDNNTCYVIIERCAFPLEEIITNPQTTPDVWLPYIARDILQALHYMHGKGYVHKDIHAGNVLVSQTPDRMAPHKERVWSFKVGDVGLSRLITEINPFNTALARWMLPPEAVNCKEFGLIGYGTDIYHTALLLLALLLKKIPSFSEAEIVEGIPRKLAEQNSSAYAPAIARALRRHVKDRTPSAIEFWREIEAASKSSQRSPAHPRSKNTIQLT